MKKLIIMILIMLVTIGIAPQFTAAQDNSTPLVITMDGDLWLWREGAAALERLTEWGYNGRPVVSPDGRYVAYNSVAQFAVEALAANQFPWVGSPPSNIWVIDLQTGEASRLADQPENPSFPIDTHPGNLIVRSDPVWSPDGAALAWLEYDGQNFVFRLVKYDFVNRVPTVIASDVPIGFADAGIYVPAVKWGAGGILYHHGTFTDEGRFEQVAHVYSPDGTLISSTPLSSITMSEMGETVFEVEWVEYHEQAQLGVLYNTGRFMVLEPNFGRTEELPSGLEVYNPAVPFQELSASVGVSTSVDESMGVQATWFAVPKGGGAWEQLPYTGYGDMGWLAISPDGNTIAYLLEEGVYLWRNGVTTLVPGTENILLRQYETPQAYFMTPGIDWGQTAWRIAGFVETLECPIFSRLQVGMRAQVIPNTTPNALRSAPGTGDDSAELGLIQPGKPFSIIGGPACVDNYLWWQVDYNGSIGWTAEGDSSTYWLEPTR